VALNPEYYEMKEGGTILFGSGEYSDYYVEGLYKVLKDFNIKEAEEQYKTEHGKPMKAWGAVNRVHATKVSEGDIEFTAWLTSEGYVDNIDYVDFHLGSYGEFELS